MYKALTFSFDWERVTCHGENEVQFSTICSALPDALRRLNQEKERILWIAEREANGREEGIRGSRLDVNEKFKLCPERKSIAKELIKCLLFSFLTASLPHCLPLLLLSVCLSLSL